jgi:hypothetical protein
MPWWRTGRTKGVSPAEALDDFSGRSSQFDPRVVENFTTFREDYKKGCHEKAIRAMQRDRA